MLEHILKEMERDKIYFYNKAWFNPLLWFIGAGIFLGLFMYSKNNGSIEVILLISALSGLVTGVLLMLQLSHKTWLHLKQHVNVHSIKNRINEINTYKIIIQYFNPRLIIVRICLIAKLQ